MKKKYITGARFGKLVVHEMQYGVNIGSRKRTCCLCKCDCGNTAVITMDALNSGRTSCGCDTSVRRSEKNRKDLTGMKYGRLTVLYMDWSARPSKAICRCECGSIITVIASSLPYGKTQSCGCLQSERTSASNTKDWTSAVSPYGIKLIKQSYMNSHGQWLWECQCGLCNQIFVALPAKIMNGHITSCGCRRQSSREQLIRDELRSLGVKFTEQYSFCDCVYKHPLLFDFAVFVDGKLYCLIEYDGKQHFQPISHFGGKEEFAISKLRDNIKNEYCKYHNIRLIRMPYTLSDEEIKTKLRDIIIRRDCNAVISNNNGFAVLPSLG